MARIKSVQKAHTVLCRDAVTKEAVQAVLSESHNAVYKSIDIHKVKNAYVAETSEENVCCVYNSPNDILAKKAIIDYVHTDVSGCKKVNKNLTLEELFRNI